MKTKSNIIHAYVPSCDHDGSLIEVTAAIIPETGYTGVKLVHGNRWEVKRMMPTIARLAGNADFTAEEWDKAIKAI